MRAAAGRRLRRLLGAHPSPPAACAAAPWPRACPSCGPCCAGRARATRPPLRRERQTAQARATSVVRATGEAVCSVRGACAVRAPTAVVGGHAGRLSVRDDDGVCVAAVAGGPRAHEEPLLTALFALPVSRNGSASQECVPAPAGPRQPLTPLAETAEPAAKAKAAAKAVAKGTSKKKVLKKRFSVTFHRCAAEAAAGGAAAGAGCQTLGLEAREGAHARPRTPPGRRR